MKGFSFVWIALLITVISACQTPRPPLEEYSIARAAIESARAVQAPRHSPGFWSQADEAYRQGRLYYKDRDYDSARAAFLRARNAAEKAENSARAIRQKTGDVL